MSFLSSALSERLEEVNRVVNNENKKKNDIQQDRDEDDMGYAYSEPIRWGYLNDYKGVFANNDDENALNTAKSVFDKTAIFHVKQE